MLDINEKSCLTARITALETELDKTVPPLDTTKGKNSRHNGYPANPADQTKRTPPWLPKEPKGLKLDNAKTMNAEQAKEESLKPPKERDTPKSDVQGQTTPGQNPPEDQQADHGKVQAAHRVRLRPITLSTPSHNPKPLKNK